MENTDSLSIRKLFLFDENLHLLESEKNMIEKTELDLPPGGRATFEVNLNDFFLLTAEKFQNLGQAEYIIIRKSTQKEKNEFYRDDIEAELLYIRPNKNSSITYENMHEALRFLLYVTPDIIEIHSRMEYKIATSGYEKQIRSAMLTITRFGMAIFPLTIDHMQEVYRSFVDNTEYLQTTSDASIVGDAINKSWSGVGPWTI